jgi:hypothetical protein
MTLPVSTRAPASCAESATPSDLPTACESYGGVTNESPAQRVPAGLRFCREADSVVEGYLCDERTVVSNACRQPHNSFDAYICDEPRMKALQNDVLRRTLSILKTLLGQLLRG